MLKDNQIVTTLKTVFTYSKESCSRYGIDSLISLVFSDMNQSIQHPALICSRVLLF